MTNKDLLEGLERQFQQIQEHLYIQLHEGEDLSLNLAGEKSKFLRFNHSKIRQSTDVLDVRVYMTLQKQWKKNGVTFNLEGSTEVDLAKSSELLKELQMSVEGLPKDPAIVPILDHGQSRDVHFGELPDADSVHQDILSVTVHSDFSGVLAMGVVVEGSANSKGQNHFYATENFSLDYSLFNDEKAAKGNYAGTQWSNVEWQNSFNETKKSLQILDLPQQSIERGEYRAYLAPAAVKELLETISGGGVSEGAYQHGQCPLSLLHEGQTWSKKFSLRENFNLGFTQAFNELGEVSPTQVNIVEQGVYQNFLTSSRTAKEFGLLSNQAGEGEYLRSTELDSGELKKEDVLKSLGTGIYLSNLHYLNWSDTNEGRITGMTRYACFWVEDGEIKGPIKDLRFDEHLSRIFGEQLEQLTDFRESFLETTTYDRRHLMGCLVPGAMVSSFKFTL
ncbi:MAG: TldD/PmbA family protein [Bdellovibrionaceae bacterium]|jgi:predicted Zn-dependent protease|nr:TldD/PmbA family protein [Pseudobdellovibrionaceae bacterium]